LTAKVQFKLDFRSGTNGSTKTRVNQSLKRQSPLDAGLVEEIWMNVAGQFSSFAIDGDRNSGSLPWLQVRDFFVRQWRLVAFFTALGIIVAIVYLAITPSRYTAQT